MCGFVTALLERKFYVIGFEYMLEVQKSGDDVEYMPVELGLVEWSMRSGISREFYRMINPGQLLFTAGDGRNWYSHNVPSGPIGTPIMSLVTLTAILQWLWHP